MSEEVIQVTVVEVVRPFLATPLEEYTVTEGLLLLILFVLIVKFICKAVKEGFYWLW